MNHQLTQDERLTRLVEVFKADSGEYSHIETPKDTQGRRRILRSLMNIRRPGPLPGDALRLQDEYLRGRAAEKGVVTLSDIPVIRSGLSIWQGDITRLAVDEVRRVADIVTATNDEDGVAAVIEALL